MTRFSNFTNEIKTPNKEDDLIFDLLSPLTITEQNELIDHLMKRADLANKLDFFMASSFIKNHRESAINSRKRGI